MRGFMYRIVITCINIFFPPLAVLMLCGASWDCMLNCALFLLAIIPSHVHGFYISCTYFHRRSKVKKGRWPGNPKPLIYSEYVINGGASNTEVEVLWRKEHGISRRGSRKSSRKPSRERESEMAQRPGSRLSKADSRISRAPSQGYAPSTRSHYGSRRDRHVSRDGYGELPVQRTASTRKQQSMVNGRVPVSPVASNVSGRSERWA